MKHELNRTILDQLFLAHDEGDAEGAIELILLNSKDITRDLAVDTYEFMVKNRSMVYELLDKVNEPPKPKRQVMQCKSCDTVMVFPPENGKPKRCYRCGSMFLREGTSGPVVTAKVHKAVDDYDAKVKRSKGEI